MRDKLGAEDTANVSLYAPSYIDIGWIITAISSCGRIHIVIIIVILVFNSTWNASFLCYVSFLRWVVRVRC